ncbi:hypothetical protein [Clostridium thermarum]|uniref:hypothetical protein n=1 Tax=Clostridium thermarum TaxID=1716543 RepID=UPI0015D6619F|nr:hypothetical protein [Clostridium thermarum]
MDRWGIYELLKSNKQVDIKEIERIPAEEVKEGLIEYLLMRNNSLCGKGREYARK